jgi:hypothetical protein
VFPSLLGGPGSTDSFTSGEKISSLASLRARLGYTWASSTLFYVTGGGGWESPQTNATISANTAATVFGQSATGDFSNTRSGFVAGSGLEWMATPNWLLRVERSALRVQGRECQRTRHRQLRRFRLRRHRRHVEQQHRCLPHRRELQARLVPLKLAHRGCRSLNWQGRTLAKSESGSFLCSALLIAPFGAPRPTHRRTLRRHQRPRAVRQREAGRATTGVDSHSVAADSETNGNNAVAGSVCWRHRLISAALRCRP